MAKISLAILLMLAVQAAWAACPDDPEDDLCDGDDGLSTKTESDVDGAVRLHATGTSSLFLMIFAALRANEVKNPAMPMLILPLVGVLPRAMAAEKPKTTCGDVKTMYKGSECCGNADKELEVQVVPNPTKRITGTNPCAGKKDLTDALSNSPCFQDVQTQIEQSGADISEDFVGELTSGVTPIREPYFKTALCPVNVHWHLGAEHRSKGQFDENGTSPENHLVPEDENPEDTRRLSTGPYRLRRRVEGARRLAGARYGYACRHYDKDDARFNTEYAWQFCKDMHVGETYEVHWPHSALGACGTPYQYQDPFYDGVFCGIDAEVETLGLSHQTIANSVGVQGQVFTVINDEDFFYPNMISGMIVDAEHNMGVDITVYTGSTTGQSRSNTVCSNYAPITWQVDRKCHLISASSFDKLCADMLQMRDDMSGDIHPHGARELVWKNLTANNQEEFNSEFRLGDPVPEQ